jgi:hypothetical protein
VVCRSPKLNALVALVDGVIHDGALADCVDARLNSNMCGLDASWFEANPAEKPITTLRPPTTAAAQQSFKPLSQGQNG